MDALRSFLSGRRLAIIGILLAIPFVFFGSSSFGTVFTNYGKVNGLTVSALDRSIAINTVATFTGPTILANVQVNGETIFFSSSTQIDAQSLPTGSKQVTVTTSGGSFTLASTNDSLQLLKGNGRFIAEFTIISKE